MSIKIKNKIKPPPSIFSITFIKTYYILLFTEVKRSIKKTKFIERDTNYSKI